MLLYFYNAQSISVVHEDFKIAVCSGTEKEVMYGSDDEELWHADFNMKTEAETLPDFGDHMTLPGLYEYSVRNMAICKSNLALWTRKFMSPPPVMGKS